MSASNPSSIVESREYGGAVFRDQNGQFGFTTHRGSQAGVNPQMDNIPQGTTATAYWHTHGDYVDPSTNNVTKGDRPRLIGLIYHYDAVRDFW